MNGFILKTHTLRKIKPFQQISKQHRHVTTYLSANLWTKPILIQNNRSISKRSRHVSSIFNDGFLIVYDTRRCNHTPLNIFCQLNQSYSSTTFERNNDRNNSEYIHSLLKQEPSSDNQKVPTKSKRAYEYLPKKIGSNKDIRSFAKSIKGLTNMKSDHGANLALKTLRVMPTMGIKPNE